MAIALAAVVSMSVAGSSVAQSQMLPPADGSPAAAGTVSPPACTGINLIDGFARDGRLKTIEAAAAAIPNGEGKFYRIEREGVAPSWLYGTMHLSDPRVLTLPEQSQQAFDSAGRLVIETTDILDEAKTLAALFSRPDLMNLPGGQTLETLLSPEQKAKLEAALAKRGVPIGTIHTLQPWFSGVSLLAPACEAARKASGVPVLDASLALTAKAVQKPVEGLETAVEQLEAMASLPMDLQVGSLIATVELGDRMPDINETMLQLYLQGRIAMITPTIEAVAPTGGTAEESAKAYAEFEQRIVTARNHTMLERMQPMLKAGGSFVAVGALHLPGADGLVALLRTGGWTVTRLD
ncbi:TraB/GumN family protein [Mangrovicella endophytica]|uniref:TraB/GumN family protein n=1 Tax=Mangrovicella endophytica TaxID=2066697 RepID=UPI001FE07606|nr:TraB/GumN family protein [Mangrovicella endophytica]